MKSVQARWQRVLITCGKCSRKLRGGFGADGDQSLAKALAAATGGGRKRKSAVGIVESKCLGVCPKGAAVALDAARPGRWLIVPAGSDVGEVLERLGFPLPRTGGDGGGPAVCDEVSSPRA